MKIIKIESDGVDAFEPMVREFLRDILGHEEALITDMTSLSDFIDFTLKGETYEAAKKEIWEDIRKKYGVDCSEQTNLLEILRTINAPKGHA